MILQDLFETAPQTKTPQFKAWFRKSKAVKNGQPIMFYHGATKEFRAFDPQYSNTTHDMPPAFFFTNKPDVAQSYAGEHTDAMQWDSDESWDAYQDLHSAGKTEQAFAFRDAHTKKNVKTWKTGAHVMPVYLRMENPLRASGGGNYWNEISFEGEYISTKDLLYIAKERGCDSIIVKNVHDRAHGKGKPSTIVAVFSPDQIKSAITNTGDYSSSHNIDESALYEGRDALLYHSMNAFKAIDVFKKDMMPAKWEHCIFSPGSPKQRVLGNSFTRNKRYLHYESSSILITVDQRTLSHKNKIMPVDADLTAFKYHEDRLPTASHWRSRIRNFQHDYMDEEFVIGDIKNLHLHIKEIRILEPYISVDANLMICIK